MVYITKQGWYIYKKDDISAKLILKNGISATKKWYIYKNLVYLQEKMVYLQNYLEKWYIYN